ncbi:hypothetical protein AAE02nite_50600 [Adhaeribacter aerolatus]|uniref:Uncharacterized protein n=1 Tax=Adhaeribacter aerolatus TaxID=670289 RepID=A0A512B5Z9_9BACT|nr:protealysin inhibitor emfourin [Adhaeribacter aerolatus]GEO07396.1 hypothetical protein AAE02nite_50600 [Adhaeribacter aerolatus]
MKVYFKPEGGFGFFPGLNKPLELNSEDLPEDEASHLKNLIKEAQLFELSNQPLGTTHGADQKKYTIRVEDQDRQHWIQIMDTERDPGLQNLLAYLSQKQKEIRKMK